MLLPPPNVVRELQPIMQGQKIRRSYQPLQAPRMSELSTNMARHSVNIQSSILRDDGLVPDRSLVVRTEISRCSLSTLVKCLTDCEPSTNRDQFVSAFFATSELFCAPEEILSALIRRFNAADYAKASKQGYIQLRVCRALRVWLESNWNPATDQRILASLEDFVTQRIHIALPMYSAFLLHLIKDLPTLETDKTDNDALATDEKNNPCQHANLVTLKAANNFFNDRNDQPPILDMCHKHLACQITVKQMRIFCSIQRKELLAERWMLDKSSAPNVASMMQLSDGISNWVKHSILTDLDPKNRGAIIGKWILVAQHLFQLNNFEGLVAVTSGLDDHTVSRLRASWNAVSLPVKESLRCLRMIVDPSGNRKKLQALTVACSGPCLPVLRSYLGELFFTNGQYKDGSPEQGKGSVGSERIINWDKYARIASIVKVLTSNQRPYDITPDDDLQRWIQKGTSELWCKDQFCIEEACYQRSSFLESGVPLRKSQTFLRAIFKKKD
ncbi:Ras guanine-nucleotide exchange Cdc25p [Fusarium tjaetaba]|uniref:Ras guanine-nucleotide exchange Cdc25p n=1 Tax=Fusarium tjaetaba TaxID=1567544 RepID=A0A8H5QNN0_9HYPO|nr:Ras guanine-nucleotide exchange Cdc25p [Fusarium tjaetaba]KAF5617046.1 Ras guanine-nucleotide exchange Cdc25p [Fusarium tjaetaba]